MNTFEITLKIATNMPEHEVEQWVEGLIDEDANTHLLKGETIELAKVVAA